MVPRPITSRTTADQDPQSGDPSSIPNIQKRGRGAVTASQGKSLGNFVVEEEIGRGGMGVVLLARQPLLDRAAVLKKVRRDLAEVPELAERFRREARAAGAVHHANVVSVYDCFTWRGDHYIAQEYVDGVDLDTALTRAGGLPWRIASLIALEAVRGLEEIHAQGTVHRDLKPSNVLLGRRGEVKIADFGIALEASGSTLTQPGALIGTPCYMPPEQLMGERVDGRGDIFSLGVVWYEMLTGIRPYPETTELDPESLLQRMQKERYDRVRKHAPRTPRAVVRMLRRCLRPKPRRRFGSARELRRRLESLLDRPSPADSRAELASYLWERGIFDTRDNETVVVIRDTALPIRRRRPLRWLAAAAILGAATAASLQWIDTTPLTELAPNLPWTTFDLDLNRPFDSEPEAKKSDEDKPAD